MLLLKFCMLLFEFIVHAPGSKESDIILDVLSLIDVSLTGNLILIVNGEWNSPIRYSLLPRFP